jgi:hypothetical protein
LEFLYRNERERSAWTQRVRNHAVMKRSGEYFEKAMLLAPKRAETYAQMLATRMFLREADGVKDLIDKLRTADVDTASIKKHTLDYIQGRDLDKTRRKERVGVARMRKAIARLKGRKDATFALACSRLSSGLMSLGMIGDRVDADEVVRLAEDAYQAAPSSGTRKGLITALAFRALTSASGKDPALAKKVRKHLRTVGVLYLFAALLRHDDAARIKLQTHPDVERLVALQKENDKSFPNDHSAVEWALMSRVDPRRAARIVPMLRNDSLRSLAQQAMAMIYPINTKAAMDAYWEFEMNGKLAEAAKIVEDYRKLGIELPVPKP